MIIRVAELLPEIGKKSSKMISVKKPIGNVTVEKYNDTMVRNKKAAAEKNKKEAAAKKKTETAEKKLPKQTKK